MADITNRGLEIGFGSPTWEDIADDVSLGIYSTDMGFGAPQNIEYETIDGDTNTYRHESEQGFGDPFEGLDLIILLQGEAKQELSEHGGEVIEVRGNLRVLYEAFRIPLEDIEFNPIGPFEIDFINTSTNTVYHAYSGIPGRGKRIYSTVNQDRIFFSTPPMPKGFYDLKIKYGSNFLFNYYIEDAFRVIHRVRNEKVKNIRRSLPDFWDKGHYHDQYKHSIDYEDYKVNESNFEILTNAFGSALNNLWTNDYTITTAVYELDDTYLEVESTLGLPASGKVIVGNQELEYTSKTPTRLYISGSQYIIPEYTKVHLPHTKLSEIDNFYKKINTGLYKPQKSVRHNDWLTAFRYIEYAERPSLRVIFRYLREMFRSVDLICNVTISGQDVSEPEGENDPIETWNCQHYQRVCEIDGKWYFIESDGSAGGLKLDPVGSTYWNAADFEEGQYVIKVFPWWVKQDSKGKFELIIEKTVFAAIEGFIDKDFIDYNIWIGGQDISATSSNNLNLDLMVSSGVIDLINLEQRCDPYFGTFWQNQQMPPNTLQIAPIRNLV